MPDVAALLGIERRQDLPDFGPGDTVRVSLKVVEGSRERVQVFEGVVIALHAPKQPDGTFTVRRVAHSVGVERIFPINSPRIDKIEVLPTVRGPEARSRSRGPPTRFAIPFIRSRGCDGSLSANTACVG